MIKVSQKQQKVVALILENGSMSSSAIHVNLLKSGEQISLVTVKRMLSEMAKNGLLISMGAGRATSYNVSTGGRLFTDIDAHEYASVEPDKRYGSRRYNFDLFAAWPPENFSPEELKQLEHATAEYENRTNRASKAAQKKELERLIIELSWKSSKIEGNTYTLLDTEKLIRENKTAPGKTREEAQMILNHKDAFLFVHENATSFQNLTRENLEALHAILVKNLSVNRGLRKSPVGITGSVYQPLDNIYQITEAVDALTEAVARVHSPYGKALTALLGVGYVQPFEDGNKRTARLATNALLLAYGCAPLSYRSIDENEYREAMLVFYEINSLVPFKKIFIDQYTFAAQNYAVK